MTRQLFRAALLLFFSGCGDGPTDPIIRAGSVDVNPPTATLHIGGTIQLDATVLDEEGRTISAVDLAWSAADQSVATVSASGLVEGRAAGMTFIRAMIHGQRDSAAITVLVPPPASLVLEPVLTGVVATHGAAPAGDSRLFLTTLDGRVLVLPAGSATASLFLDLRARVKGGAHGLYGIAFHPNFSANGFYFVAYVDRNENFRVERYVAMGSASGTVGKLIIQVDHPPPYDHFGGWIGFGPDGLLYITSGDGGPGNAANAQNPSSLLGKILRIDVDRADPYAIPGDNPFASGVGSRREIWATGLRNPWRAAIHGGMLYTPDVGEDHWEEINVSPLTAGGLNYGWARTEGTSCFPATVLACDRSGLTMPVLEYPLTGSGGTSVHPSGCSVTGGFVYRGSRIPGLRGHYVYGDFCAGWVRSFRYQDGRLEDQRQWFSGTGSIIGFAEDAAGELYVLTISGTVR